MLHRMLSSSRVVALSALLAACALAVPRAAAGQVALDEENRVDLVLDDGTTVTLLGAAKGIGDRSSKVEYYYLPTGLRLSKGADGRPQFLFLKYNTESGDTQGGVLHFLMEWGLSQQQLAEAREKLREVCEAGVRSRHFDRDALRSYMAPDVKDIQRKVSSQLGPARRMPGFASGHSTITNLLPVNGAVPCGEIRGAARVTTRGDSESFRVISATLSSDEMTRSLISSGTAPVLPGNRIAVAADMNSNGAQLLAAPFEKDMPIGDLSLELDLAFTSRVPAGEGRIVLHWDRLAEEGETLSREWDKRKIRTDADSIGRLDCNIFKRFFTPRKCDVETVADNRKWVSDVEMRDLYSFLMEQEVIELDFRENVADERLTAVREAFFQYFLDAFAEPVSAEEMAQLRDAGESAAEELAINENKRNYYRSLTSRSVAQSSKEQEFRLNYHLAYERPFSVVQNIKSWYDDVEANYPEAMAAVTLNDPFFRNRTIRFRLDFDAPQELFSPGGDRSSAINYVTVQMRKKRGPGENDFRDYVTIDENYIAEHGLFAEMTFAEGAEDDAEAFEYMTQWSYGSGFLYPKQEEWIEASTPAITLTPPVTPRRIEVEGDLAEMESSDIARITVQVLYQKFGEPFVENIPVSPAQGEPLVQRTIFVDRDEKGYAYRLVIHHKREGRMATDWDAKVNDNYVYAAVPTDVLQDASLLEQAKAAARDVSGQALEAAKKDVLARFESVLGSD